MDGSVDFALVFGSGIAGVIVTARSAEARHRAWWAWSLAALVLWSLATLPNLNTPLSEWPWVLAVIVPWLPLAFMRLVLSSEGQQTCPHCRSKVPVSATVCRTCQRDMNAAVIG